MELTELIEAARKGDDVAFTALVNAYKPMINGLIRAYGLDERDVFTDACLRLRAAVERYDPSRGLTFGLYAKICVEKAMLDAVKVRDRDLAHLVDGEVDVDGIAVPGGIQAMLEHRERSARFVAAARRVLSGLEFDVFHYWMLGYKTSEIASALGISAKAVDNAKNRMWTKLRSNLPPED
jgi:RNA polymerase sporulation-specific sigma factor